MNDSLLPALEEEADEAPVQYVPVSGGRKPTILPPGGGLPAMDTVFEHTPEQIAQSIALHEYENQQYRAALVAQAEYERQRRARTPSSGFKSPEDEQAFGNLFKDGITNKTLRLGYLRELRGMGRRDLADKLSNDWASDDKASAGGIEQPPLLDWFQNEGIAAGKTEEQLRAEFANPLRRKVIFRDYIASIEGNPAFEEDKKDGAAKRYQAVSAARKAIMDEYGVNAFALSDQEREQIANLDQGRIANAWQSLKGQAAQGPAQLLSSLANIAAKPFTDTTFQAENVPWLGDLYKYGKNEAEQISGKAQEAYAEYERIRDTEGYGAAAIFAATNPDMLALAAGGTIGFLGGSFGEGAIARGLTMGAGKVLGKAGEKVGTAFSKTQAAVQKPLDALASTGKLGAVASGALSRANPLTKGGALLADMNLKLQQQRIEASYDQIMGSKPADLAQRYPDFTTLESQVGTDKAKEIIANREAVGGGGDLAASLLTNQLLLGAVGGIEAAALRRAGLTARNTEATLSGPLAATAKGVGKTGLSESLQEGLQQAEQNFRSQQVQKNPDGIDYGKAAGEGLVGAAQGLVLGGVVGGAGGVMQPRVADVKAKDKAAPTAAEMDRFLVELGRQMKDGKVSPVMAAKRVVQRFGEDATKLLPSVESAVASGTMPLDKATAMMNRLAPGFEPQIAEALAKAGRTAAGDRQAQRDAAARAAPVIEDAPEEPPPPPPPPPTAIDLARQKLQVAIDLPYDPNDFAEASRREDLKKLAAGRGPTGSKKILDWAAAQDAPAPPEAAPIAPDPDFEPIRTELTAELESLKGQTGPRVVQRRGQIAKILESDKTLRAENERRANAEIKAEADAAKAAVVAQAAADKAAVVAQAAADKAAAEKAAVVIAADPAVSAARQRARDALAAIASSPAARDGIQRRRLSALLAATDDKGDAAVLKWAAEQDETVTRGAKPDTGVKKKSGAEPSLSQMAIDDLYPTAASRRNRGADSTASAGTGAPIERPANADRSDAAALARTDAKPRANGDVPGEPAGALRRLQNRNRSEPESVRQMNSIAGKPDPDRLGFSRELPSGAPVVEGGAPAVTGKAETATTGAGRKLPITYAVVEADDLIASHDVNGTVNPSYSAGQAGKSRAIAGNGRVAGLKAAYERGTTAPYVDGIIADESLHGVPAASIRAMKRPILVRIMRDEDVTDNIGDESNQSGTAGLSPVDQAKTDIRRLDITGLDFTESGNFTTVALNAFVQGMPESERPSLRDGSQPNIKAEQRAMSALFAAAYESDALIRLQAQATDNEAATVMKGLAIATAKMAQLRGAGEYDIRALVTESAEIIVSARRNERNLNEEVLQQDLVRSPEVGPVLRMMVSNIASARRIGEKLNNLAQTFYDESIKEGVDIFGEPRVKRSRAELLENFDESRVAQDTGNARGSTMAAAGDGRPADGRERQEGQRPAISLASQTEQSRLASERQTKERITAERQARQDAENRAAADKGRDSFTLSTGDATLDAEVNGGQKPLLSQSPASGLKSGLPLSTIQSILRRLFPGNDRFTALRNPSELPNGSADRGLAIGTEGLFDPITNRFYLFADNISDEKRAVWVAAHEGSHYGIHNLHSGHADYAETLKQASQNETVSGLATAIQADRQRDGQEIDRLTAVDEALAELDAALTATADGQEGAWESLKDRYNVDVPKGLRLNRLRNVVARWIAALTRVLNKLMAAAGQRTVGGRGFTDAQVRELLGRSRRAAQRGVVRSAKQTTNKEDGQIEAIAAFASTAPNGDKPSPDELAKAGRQRDAVVAAHKPILDAFDKRMRAWQDGGRKGPEPRLPAGNGKDSKLNRNQWILVRTDNFLRWFGNWINDPANASKVVDQATGEPRIIYRGESSGDVRNHYSPDDTREHGLFFSPEREMAAGYEENGKPREFFVRARSLLDLTADTIEAERFIRKWASRHKEWTDRVSGEEVDPVSVVHSGFLFDWEGDWSGERWKSLQSAALDEHEATLLPDIGGDDRRIFPALVVRDGGAQIKSATSNVGTFSDRGDIRFSRASERSHAYERGARRLGTGGGVKLTDLKRIADQTGAQTFATVAEARKRFGQIPADAQGFYDPVTGTVALIAENIRDAKEAQLVHNHEVIGHKGLRAILTPLGFKKLMEQVGSNPMVRMLADAWKRANPKVTDDLVAREEALAQMAENDLGDLTFWERVSAIIRQFARNAGFVKDYTDLDIKALLGNARKAVLEGAPADSTVTRNADGTYTITMRGGATRTQGTRPARVVATKDATETWLGVAARKIQDIRAPMRKMSKAVMPFFESIRGKAVNTPERKKFMEDLRKRFESVAGVMPAGLDQYLANADYGLFNLAAVKDAAAARGAYREKSELTELKEAARKLAREYAEAYGVDVDAAMQQMSDYLHAKHASERNEVYRALYANLDQGAKAERTRLITKFEKDSAALPDGAGLSTRIARHRTELIAHYKANWRAELEPEIFAQFDDAQAAQIVKAFEAKVSPIHRKSLDSWRKAMQDKVLEYGRESGRWSRKAEIAKELYGFKNYVPMKGWDAEANPDKPFGEFTSGLARPIVAAQGRDSLAGNAMSQMLTDAQVGIRDVEERRIAASAIAQHLAGIKRDDGGVAADIRVAPVGAAPSENTVWFFNGDDTITAIEYGKERAVMPDGELSIMSKQVDNERRDFAINYADGIKEIRQQMGKGTAGLSVVTRAYGRMKTQYNPDFWFTGAFRDYAGYMITAAMEHSNFNIGQAIAYSRYTADSYAGGKTWTFSTLYDKGDMATLAALAKGDEFFAKALEFAAQGGMTSMAQVFNADHNFDSLMEGNERQGIKQLKSANRFMERWNGGFELASRVAMYRTLRDMGWTEQDAAVYTKNLTNFEVSGEWGKHLGAIYVFFRPSATGVMRLAQAMRSNPERAALMASGMVAAGAMFAMLSALGAPEDEEGNKVLNDDSSRWTRSLRFFVPGYKRAIQIPLPYGMGAFFATGAQTYLAAYGTSGDTERRMKEFAQNMVTIAIDSHSPLQPSGLPAFESGSYTVGKLLNTVVPSVVRPLNEYYANISNFGNKIYTEWGFGKVPSNAYYGQTRLRGSAYDQLARWAYDSTDGALDMAPGTLDHITNSYATPLDALLDIVFAKDNTERIGTAVGGFSSSERDIAAARWFRISNEVNAIHQRRDVLANIGGDRLREFDERHPGVEAAHNAVSRYEKELRASYKRAAGFRYNNDSVARNKAYEREDELRRKVRGEAYLEELLRPYGD